MPNYTFIFSTQKSRITVIFYFFLPFWSNKSAYLKKEKEVKLPYLCSSESELEHLDVLSSCLSESGRVCGDEAGVVDEVEQGGLQQLADRQRADHRHQRTFREHHGAWKNILYLENEIVSK